MRISIQGDCVSANALRDGLRRAGRAVSDYQPTFTLYIEEDPDVLCPVVIGSGGPLMQAVGDYICKYTQMARVVLERQLGLASVVTVKVPCKDEERLACEVGIALAMASLVRGPEERETGEPIRLMLELKTDELPRKGVWVKLKKLLLTPVACLLLATSAGATDYWGRSHAHFMLRQPALLFNTAIATAADPTWPEGAPVPLSVNLAGELRVAGTFSGGGDGAIEDGVDPALEATVGDLANSNPLATMIVDANGDQITSFGGGTEVAQGTAAIAGEVLKMAGAIRRDTAALDAGVADGDRAALSTDNVGRLRTNASDTIQPVSATNLDVQSGGADLATEATLATRLTTAAHDAAFGTAGAADAQVRSIQGIAGMTAVQVEATNLDVQSGGADLATQTSMAAAAASLSVLDDWDNAASDAASVSGDVAHDDPDAGEPVKIGGSAVAHAAPSEVAAADRTNAKFNRDGVLFTIGGNPGVITREASWADADGAQTGASIVTVSTGTLICVTRILVACSIENTVKVSVRIMFDTDGTFAARATTGVDGGLFDHRGIGPGGGANTGDGSGLLGCGTDDQDLRYSGDDPVTGSCSITVSYYTSAS